MRRLLVAVGAAALLTLPGSAGATVTASSVDSTGGPFFDHDSDGAGLVMSGHVTSDDTAGDKVKLVCQGYGQFLGPGNAGLTAEWLRGWVAAAREQDPSLRAEAGTYLRRRLIEADAGPLSATVGHTDLLALP